MPRLDQKPSIDLCERSFTPDELDDIRTMVEGFPGLARKELARTLCENLRWFTAAGGYKIDACLKLLERLAVRGFLQLPEKFRPGTRKKRTSQLVATSQETAAPQQISGSLAEVGPVSLEIVLTPEARREWKEAVNRYHYLGYKRPFGCSLAYFIESPSGRLGCLSLAGAAKWMQGRDRWIGWTNKQRRRNLPWVVNNVRFLVFPWVQVKHLASHVLGQLTRRVRRDWYERFGYRPVLLETFVDPERYQGTCYRAGGWIELGRTTGEGLLRPGCTYSTTPKMIFVQPLVANFCELLCSERLQGRVWDE
jgi:hypothetical protein